MLIINKKFSNLLKGYRRALELDQKLKTEWESRYKPQLLGKLQMIESEQMKDYQEKLLTWQESERQSITQWEEAEKTKLIEWESTEILRQTTYAAENAQNRAKSQLRIEQQKPKRTIWMILWISSASLCFFLFLIGLFARIDFVLGVIGLFSSMVICILSIVAFTFFIANCFTGINPLPGYIPPPKPQPAKRISPNQPVPPIKSESLVEKYSYPA